MAANESQVNLNVGGESAKNVDGPTTIDINDRDPTNMNSNLKVTHPLS